MTGEQRRDEWDETWPALYAMIKRRQRRRENRRMIIAIAFFGASACVTVSLAWYVILAVVSIFDWIVGR